MGATALVVSNKNTKKTIRSLLIFLLVAIGMMCFFFNSQITEVYASSGNPAAGVSSSGSTDLGESSFGGDSGIMSAPADSSGGESSSNQGTSTESVPGGDSGEAMPSDSSGDDSGSNEGTPADEGLPAEEGPDEAGPAQDTSDESEGNGETDKKEETDEQLPSEEGLGPVVEEGFDEADPAQGTSDESEVNEETDEKEETDEQLPSEEGLEEGLDEGPVVEEGSGEADPAQDTSDESEVNEETDENKEIDENIPAENFVDPCGTVYDAITKQAIKDASVVLKQWDGTGYADYGDNGDGQTYISTDGKYKFDLETGHNYQITASATDYLSYTWNFSQDDDNEHKIDFYLVPIVTGISSGWASFDNEVTINHDIETKGYDIEIRAPDGRGEGVTKEAREDAFESITLTDGKIISTRKLAEGEADHNTGASGGNSGSIKVWSPNITIGEGAQLLAHVENGSIYTAGDITLEALAAAGTDALDILVANVDHPKTSISINDNAILKGKIVTLTAKSDCTHINVPIEGLELEEGDTEEEIEKKLELAGIVEMGTEFMEELVLDLSEVVHGALEVKSLKEIGRAHV